ATRRGVYWAEWREAPGTRGGDPAAKSIVEIGGARSYLLVPLLKDNEVAGAITIFRKEVRPFNDKQIQLLVNFADQAVIAIENTRLFEAEQASKRELQESLEYQTATSEVLNVISRSPTRLQPVLNTIAEIAARLCGADWALIRKLGPDGKYHAVAFNGAQDDFIEFVSRYSIVPSRDLVAGRALLERKSIHIADVVTEAN